MQVLQTFSLVLSVLTCLFLIFLVLIQSGKSDSLGIFGGASSTTAFGTSTADMITKLTWWLVACFFVFSILTAVVFAEAGPSIEAPSVLEAEPTTEEKEGAEESTPEQKKVSEPKTKNEQKQRNETRDN